MFLFCFATFKNEIISNDVIHHFNRLKTLFGRIFLILYPVIVQKPNFLDVKLTILIRFLRLDFEKARTHYFKRFIKVLLYSWFYSNKLSGRTH